MKSSPTEIAQRYVNALFPLACDANAVAAVEKDLDALAEAAVSQPAFANFLNNPLVNRAQQKAVIAEMAKTFSAHKLTAQFLTTLAGANRLSLIAVVAEQFKARAEAQRGEVTADVTTPVKLDSAQAAAVAEQLGKALGKKVTVISHEDSSLLSGMVVKIGSQQLDASLVGKLNRLNIALKAA